MNFRDTLVTCQECGKRFVFTVERQRQLADQGLDVVSPDLCGTCTQRVKYGGRFHGRIKWFDLGKGYGFIVQDDGSDIFVHREGITLTEEGALPPMEEGQEVLYQTRDTPRGPQAVQVTPYQG